MAKRRYLGRDPEPVRYPGHDPELPMHFKLEELVRYTQKNKRKGRCENGKQYDQAHKGYHPAKGSKQNG